MKNIKRALSLALALCMMMALCVVGAHAAVATGEVFADFEGGSVPSFFAARNGGTVTLNTNIDYAKGTASLVYNTSNQNSGFTIALPNKPANCVGIAFDYKSTGWDGGVSQFFRVIAATDAGYAAANRVIDDKASDMAKQSAKGTDWSHFSYDFREMYKPSTNQFATNYANIQYVWFLPNYTDSFIYNYIDNFTYLLDDGTEVPTTPTTPPEEGCTVTYYQNFEDFDVAESAEDIKISARFSYDCQFDVVESEGRGKVLQTSLGASYSGFRILTSDYAIPQGCVGFTFDVTNDTTWGAIGIILAKGEVADAAPARISSAGNVITGISSSAWSTCEYIFDAQALSQLNNVGQIVMYSDSTHKFLVDNFKWIVETKVDGDATLPEITAPAGKQFIGWLNSTDSKLYKAGATYTVSAETTFTAINALVETQEGAGIRWAEQETERGLRFETYVSKDAFDAIGSSAFTVGTLILPASKYDASLTVENAASYTAVNVVDEKFYGTIGANYRYYGAVVDMEKYFGAAGTAANELALAAVGYATVTYADGTTKTFYSAFDASKNVRSAAQVANAALKDESANYSEKQIQILELYCPETLKEDTTEAYRTDAKDFQ